MTQPTDINAPLALTMGDPAGIGPELTCKAWRLRLEHSVPCFFALADTALLGRCDPSMPIQVIDHPHESASVFAAALPVLPLPERIEAEPGAPDPSNGEMTVRSISTAVEYVLGGEAAAVVTNPINKHILYEAGFGFPGHTEYLGQLAQDATGENVLPVMMLAGEGLRTIPLTIHVPLRDVPALIEDGLLRQTIEIVHRDLQLYFDLKAPRIAVCGLNPHAGESGSIGDEEQRIIIPALETLRECGLRVTGPHPADALFHEQARQSYDAVIGMYHDQALIPLKMLAFDKGVNVTLGLPFVRTSPDHGTAYDISGKGIANPTSLIEALKLAAQMSDHAAKMAETV